MAVPAGTGFVGDFSVTCFWTSFGLIQCAHNGRFSFVPVIKNFYQYIKYNRNLYVYDIRFSGIVEPNATNNGTVSSLQAVPGLIQEKIIFSVAKFEALNVIE